jgi:hypothetical protein
LLRRGLPARSGKGCHTLLQAHREVSDREHEFHGANGVFSRLLEHANRTKTKEWRLDAQDCRWSRERSSSRSCCA